MEQSNYFTRSVARVIRALTSSNPLKRDGQQLAVTLKKRPARLQHALRCLVGVALPIYRPAVLPGRLRLMTARCSVCTYFDQLIAKGDPCRCMHRIYAVLDLGNSPFVDRLGTGKIRHSEILIWTMEVEVSALWGTGATLEKRFHTIVSHLYPQNS